MPNPTFAAASLAEGLTLKFSGESQFTSKVFTVRPGKRFDKIMQGRTADRMESVHAFVNRETGGVFKAAGINRPAEGVRYTDVNDAIEAADVFGSYLYKR